MENKLNRSSDLNQDSQITITLDKKQENTNNTLIDRNISSLTTNYQSKPVLLKSKFLDTSFPSIPNLKYHIDPEEIQSISEHEHEHENENDHHLNDQEKYAIKQFRKTNRIEVDNNKLHNEWMQTKQSSTIKQIMNRNQGAITRKFLNKDLQSKMRNTKLSMYDTMLDQAFITGQIPSTKSQELSLSPNADFNNRIGTNSNLQNSYNHLELQRQNLSSYQFYKDIVDDKSNNNRRQCSVDQIDKVANRFDQKNTSSNLKLLHDSQFKGNEKKYNSVKHKKMQYQFIKKDKLLADDIEHWNQPDHQLVSHSIKNLVLVKNIINLNHKQLDFKMKLTSLNHLGDMKSYAAYIISINQSKSYQSDYLKIVDLSDNNLVIFEEQVNQLITWCIKRLILNNSKVNLTIISSISQTLEDTKIQRLSIENVNLSSSSWFEFFNNHIVNCKSLERLDVSGNQFEEKSVAGIAHMLEVDTNLIWLNISDCHIDFNSVKNIIKGLFKNHKLRVLDLSRNLLGKYKESELNLNRDIIYQYFANNKSLTHIDLSFNTMSDVISEVFMISIMSRHTYLFLHSNETNKMYDQISTINWDQVDKIRRIHKARLTGCSACDKNVQRVIYFSNQEINEDLNNKEDQAVQAQLEQQNFTVMPMEKSDQSNLFKMSLQLPNYEMKILFSTSDRPWIKNQYDDKHFEEIELKEMKHIKLLDFKEDVDVKVVKYYNLKPLSDNTPYFKFNIDLKLPYKQNRPYVLEKETQDKIDNYKNIYLKILDQKLLAKKCAIQDIENISIFNYLKQNLRIPDNLVLNFLQFLADNQILYLEIYMQMICLSCKDENPDQQVTRKGLQLFYLKVKILGIDLELTSFDNICKNIYEQRVDSTLEGLQRKELMDFNIHLFVQLQYQKDRTNFQKNQQNYLISLTEQLPQSFLSFKEMFKNKKHIQKAVNVNQAIFQSLMADHSIKKNLISIAELWSLLLKMNISIQPCEFHWHILSTIGKLSEVENLNSRDQRLDLNDFIEFFLKLFQQHPMQFIEKIDFNQMKEVFKLNRRIVISYLSNFQIDNLEWLILLFCHILFKNVQSDKGKSQVLEQFGENNTIRFQTDMQQRQSIHENKNVFADFTENEAAVELRNLIDKFVIINQDNLDNKIFKRMSVIAPLDAEDHKLQVADANLSSFKDVTVNTILFFNYDKTKAMKTMGIDEKSKENEKNKKSKGK